MPSSRPRCRDTGVCVLGFCVRHGIHLGGGNRRPRDFSCHGVAEQMKRIVIDVVIGMIFASSHAMLIPSPDPVYMWVWAPDPIERRGYWTLIELVPK